MKYWAFITYSHADARLAHRLHRVLETYQLPRALVGRHVDGRETPARLTPIFLDRAELAGAPDLSQQIKEALEDSLALIVLCSPSAAKSDWVNREIQVFQKLGKQTKIFSAILRGGLDGSPVFPTALLEQQNAEAAVSAIEPLAADLRRGKDGFRDGKLKIIAGILGVSFDSLRQRDQARRRRRRVLATLLSVLIILVLMISYVGVADSGARVPAAAGIRRTLDEHDISIFRPAASDIKIRNTAASLRQSLIAAELAELDKPDQVLRFTPDGRVGGTWELGQIVAGIARAPEAAASDLGRAKKWIQVPFEPGRATEANGIAYGWLWYQLKNPQAEAALSPIIALSALLSRNGALTPDERLQFTRDLRYAQRAALLYHRADGGWEHLPNQTPTGQDSLYTTLLGLEALLAVCEAGEQWPDENGRDRLTQMIISTVRRLIATYDREGEWQDRPGWHGSQSNREVTPVASLTLLAYFLLLRAAQLKPESVQLSPAMLSDIARRVVTLPNESGPFATDEDRLEVRFRDLDGIEKAGGYTYHEPWFPYALACANEWLRRLQASKAPRAEIVATRRVLGVLVVRFGPEVSMKRRDFYAAENLLRLDVIMPN
ncbi:MAG: toll/interleukin receptor protein [Acidobacteria bacterium]|nr:toll/interleukin receptor protein [Acidobacteriota bacterium]